MKRKLALSLGLAFFAEGSRAETLNPATTFDRAPWISARAAGLGEALSTTANGLDAFEYNPALIGGYDDHNASKPWLTHLYFPYLGLADNTTGRALGDNTVNGAKLPTTAVTNALQPTFDGDRPYSAFSATPTVVIGRFMAGYAYSHRTTGYLVDENDGTEKLHVSSRELSGPLVGFSATDPGASFYMGASVALMQASVTEAEFTQAEFNDPAQQKDIYGAAKTTYSGMPINLGMMYRFRHTTFPSISLVIDDIGATRYSPSNRLKPTDLVKENETLGFGISPHIKTWGLFNFNLEATHLSEADLDFKDKLRASTELTIGERKAADAGLSFRLGYTVAGLSYGTGINLGILTAQFGSIAEDIGAGKPRVIERRTVFNVGINIADY